MVADQPSPLYRNAIGDECVYVEAGRARVETTFGALDAGRRRLRHHPDLDDPPDRARPATGRLRTLVIEATGHIGPPKRYLSVRGQFLEHVAVLRARPARPGRAAARRRDRRRRVRPQHRRAVWTKFTYAHHPFDVVGWDGCLYPWAFSIHDFEPITGRVHQPPPVHQTFEGPNFVICSFVPRKVDYHPLSIPVPYNHHNVDSDEMLFYTGGNYEARRGSGIEQGSISLHPSGFTHGPQPGAAERAIGVDYFDELAVMVDTFRPLDLCEPALACEDEAYAWTWARRHGSPNDVDPATG